MIAKCAMDAERRQYGLPHQERLAPHDNQADGDFSSDIAICGLSFKFPGDATSADGLWKMMLEKRCATSDFPAEHFNADGFNLAARGKDTMNSQLLTRGGHFIKEDLSAFDADFFSISPAEAASMDPAQRWLLETAYRALENAGMTMESVSSSGTGVYTGAFTNDYMLQLARDPENTPAYAAQGFGLSMLSNRVSWFFNLRGPSVSVDSACSSAASALDMACQALLNGSCDMALVAGCSIARAPEGYIWLNTSSFLSPDSRCYSFDHRANGYARGEGTAVVVLKKASDAIRDENTIRAVIRSVRSNEDGKTPGITQPSQEAQESLIRETYAKAGLSRAHTRFFEAHGTGTRIGDPREAKSIGFAFRECRSDKEPIYVGAIKSNIGHLEGGSGLAGVIKTVLALERGIIPPNANYEKLNPKIDAQFLRLKFPQRPFPWPTSGLRRASVNSFGFGGSNTHIVIDDAYNYSRLRSLQAKHCSVADPPAVFSGNSSSQPQRTTRDGTIAGGNPRLLIWSAADKEGLNRIVEAYREWMNDDERASDAFDAPETFMTNLSFTLDVHRNHLPWRAFAVLRSPTGLLDLHSSISTPVRAGSQLLRLGFVFSGQGGQWHAMGRELLRYPSFKEDLLRAGDYLRSLGCPWSVIDELSQPADKSRLDEADYGQPLSTVLQVALFNLLRSFNVRPAAVVGHSSGEIAAAYAGGYIDSESAWKLAYFRGRLSAELAHTTTEKGTMMSVGVSEVRARNIITSLNLKFHPKSVGLSIGCINSPNNVTISGEEPLIDTLKAHLDDQKLLARKLRVPLAYHSPQMQAISERYLSLIGSVTGPCDTEAPSDHPPMLSSVLGQRVEASELLEPRYWVESTVRPVQFSRALSAMCDQSPSKLEKKIDRSHVLASAVDHLVEIGPHSTLQGCIRETIRVSSRETPVGYSSILKRGESATETMFQTLGELYSLGYSFDLRPANELGNENVSPSLLINLPEYPFDHSQSYWHETRLSRNYRLRSVPPSEFLGVRSRDWNSSDARWRRYMRMSEMSWAEHHVINGTTLYPGAGMLAMAVEAAKQLVIETSERKLHGYTLRDVCFENAIDLSSTSGFPEVQTSLRKLDSGNSDSPLFAFAIRTHNGGEWISNCRGFIHIEFHESHHSWMRRRLDAQRKKTVKRLDSLLSSCRTPVPSQKMYLFLRECGYHYGPSFQAAHNQHCNEQRREATADVYLSKLSEGDHVFHPTSLDAMLHICFTAFSAGGTAPMATSIPSHIRCIWISNDGLHWRPGRDCVTSCSNITSLTSRGFECGGGAFDKNGSQELRLWYEGLELTSVTKTQSWLSIPNPKQWYMNTECRVDIGLLHNDEVCSLLNERHPVEEAPPGFFNDLRLLVELSLERLIAAVDPSTVVGKNTWKSRYWDWAQNYLAERRPKRTAQDDREPISGRFPSSAVARDLEELIARLGQTNQVGRVYSRVASSLDSLFEDETNPLELLVHSGLLKGYYSELSGYRCSKQAASYIDLLAHGTPGLKILEVGGGTGATTRNIVHLLRSGSKGKPESHSLRCGLYEFTDISLAFTEKARDEFGAYDPQLRLRTLDIERDPVSQGFEEAAYDVVVADNVLHATSNLAQTLINVQKLLKPGGKLLIQEPLKASAGTLGFVFGLLNGWWAASEEERSLSPAITADAWDAALKRNGFTGADLVFKDFEDDVAHHIGWLASTAVNRESSVISNGSQNQPDWRLKATVVINKSCAEQQSLSEALLPLLRHSLGLDVQMLNVETAALVTQRDDEELVILVLDCGWDFLRSLDATSYVWLKSIVKASRRILWVFGSGAWEVGPDHGLVDGLARALRSEYFELQLVTLVLDMRSQGVGKPTHIVRVAERMLSRHARQAYEQEYLEIGGYLHTRRLVAASDLKSAMERKLVPYETVKTRLDSQHRFELSTLTLDPNAVPCFVRQDISETQEADDLVDLVMKAACLQSHHRSTALGRMSQPGDSTLHYVCSGVVLSHRTKVESELALQIGDRVLFAWNGPLRSHVRLSPRHVVKLPDELSFAGACAGSHFLTAAYHALIETAGLNKTHSVLVRDGASPIGQAALRILCEQGGRNIWTTARAEDEYEWITEAFAIDDDHILPDEWFRNQPMMLSQLETKFDIVLAAGVGVTQQVLLNHMKFGGKHISIDTGTLLQYNTLNIHGAPANISHDSFHMGSNPQGDGKPFISAASLECAIRHAQAMTGDSPQLQNETFPASDVANAFKLLQKGDSKPVVIEFNESDAVDVLIMTRPTYSLRPNASYLIVGGLGGLGRSMARWLVSRGARHLILLSRSGAKTDGARQLLSELRSQGIACETPCCDVSDETALQNALASCGETMPPIKGCIQSSMVNIETIFEKMSFSDWKAAVDPKVQGSWNLHQQLPKDLDFFILISSMMSTIGGASLSAYSAANSYMDALARYRISRGERAAALGLGIIADSGFLIENGGRLAGVEGIERYAFTRLREIFALLDIYCDPEPSNGLSRSIVNCQPVMGIRPPAHWGHLEDVPEMFSQPLWGHMRHLAPLVLEGDDSGTHLADIVGTRHRQALDAAERLSAAPSVAEAAGIASEALAQRTSAILGTPENRLDAHKPMHSYGIDSLSAIDIRNWVGQVFNVDLPVFDILGGATFATAGLSIARKVQLRIPNDLSLQVS
ncbi:hypothetical protein CP533_5339 [Ophiocordyceps camponoti-saundersi (nom. inval.)]|nr:hypothetical protein CP533_5339 [Ophiocordyceps camponoti-saundersi (nom. inval.)]